MLLKTRISKPHYFFIAAHPRSGSSYLCRLLGQYSSLDVYFEIFHTNVKTIKQHLKSAYPTVIEALGLSGNDELVRKSIVENNKHYLKILSDIEPNKLQVFKAFPGHLPNNHLESIIEDTQFIILLRRNLLHSYLSDVIATRMQRWASVDTSLELALFSVEGFIGHIRRVLNFYKIVETLAKSSGKQIVVINYEDLLITDNPYTYIADRLKEPLELANCNASKMFSKTLQDKRVMAKDKVENPDEMDAFLGSIGLLMLNSGKHYCSDNQYLSAIEEYDARKNIKLQCPCDCKPLLRLLHTYHPWQQAKRGNLTKVDEMFKLNANMIEIATSYPKHFVGQALPPRNDSFILNTE